jgi:two-component system NarL family response regulator
VLGSGPRLSEREVEILKMIALGMGNHDVAERMGVSESTVRNHVANILVKLQLRAQIETAT